MLDTKPGHALNLMHEVASVATLQGSGSLSVRLVDVSVARVRFVSSAKLDSVPSDQLSMRFTLPGNPRLHFAMVKLSAAITHEPTASCYEAEFVRTDPKTVDHIMAFLDSAAPAGKDASQYQASYQSPSANPGS